MQRLGANSQLFQLRLPVLIMRACYAYCRFVSDVTLAKFHVKLAPWEITILLRPNMWIRQPLIYPIYRASSSIRRHHTRDLYILRPVSWQPLPAFQQMFHSTRAVRENAIYFNALLVEESQIIYAFLIILQNI